MNYRVAKFRLKNVKPTFEDGIIKEIEYNYSIEDSSGLLKMELTMYNGIDEVEYFIQSLYNLYKLDHFTCYYKNKKYLYDKGSIIEIKMY